MNILLIVGFVLVAAATGLLGFVLLKGKQTGVAKSEQSGDKESEDVSVADLTVDDFRQSGARLSTATQSFFIICTLAFWVLFIGASYWAYSSQPMYGFIVACSSILVYAVVILLHELVKHIDYLGRMLEANPTGSRDRD